MMKTYAVELVMLLVQLMVFYVIPLFAGPTDAMGMVFLMMAATLVLSLILGWSSVHWNKLLWPFAVAAAFIPSVWVWYNSSALIHSVWYMFLSAAGVLAGTCLRKLTFWMRLKKTQHQ